MTKNTQDNGTVFVECVSQSERFGINEITFVSIKGHTDCIPKGKTPNKNLSL